MRQRRSLFLNLAALAFLAALVFFLRLPALPQSVIDWDESIHLLMARSMLHGHAPYTAIWDNKPPGLYVLFALAQLVFGQTVLAIRLLAVAAVTTTSFLLWMYGRCVLGSWTIGALAGLFYAIFSMRNGGLATNAEILFAPLTVAAFLLLGARTGVPETIRPNRRLTFFAIGLLFGLAIQIKSVAGMELLAALALIALAPLISRRQGRPQPLGEAALAACLLAAGAATPMLAAAAAFAGSSHFSEYFYANFTANAIYVRNAPPLLAAAVVEALLPQVRGALLLWIAAVAAVPLALMIRLHHSRAAMNLFVLGLWFLFALGATLLSRRFYPHYYLQVLPPLSLLAAAVIVQAVRLDSGLPRARQAMLVGLLVVIGLAQPAAGYVRQSLAFIAEGPPILYYLTDASIPTRFVLPPMLNDDLAPMIGVDPLSVRSRVFCFIDSHLDRYGPMGYDTAVRRNP